MWPFVHVFVSFDSIKWDRFLSHFQNIILIVFTKPLDELGLVTLSFWAHHNYSIGQLLSLHNLVLFVTSAISLDICHFLAITDVEQLWLLSVTSAISLHTCYFLAITDVEQLCLLSPTSPLPEYLLLCTFNQYKYLLPTLYLNTYYYVPSTSINIE